TDFCRIAAGSIRRFAPSIPPLFPHLRSSAFICGSNTSENGPAGGAEEGGLVVEDDVDGHGLHQRLHAALGVEAAEEGAVLQLRQDAGGDAPADVEAAE